MKATTAIGISAAAVLGVVMWLTPAPAAQRSLEDVAKEWSYPGAKVQSSGGGLSGGSSGKSKTQIWTFRAGTSPGTVWSFYADKAAATQARGGGAVSEWGRTSTATHVTESTWLASSTNDRAGTILCATPEYTASVMVTPFGAGDQSSVSLVLHANHE